MYLVLGNKAPVKYIVENSLQLIIEHASIINYR